MKKLTKILSGILCLSMLGQACPVFADEDSRVFADDSSDSYVRKEAFSEYTFEEFLELSDEEICSLSDEAEKIYKTAIRNVGISQLYVEHISIIDFFGIAKNDVNKENVNKENTSHFLEIPEEFFEIGKVRVTYDSETYEPKNISFKVFFYEDDIYNRRYVEKRGYMWCIDKFKKYLHYDYLAGSNGAIKQGDVNRDGVCDLTDLTDLSLYLLGDIEFTSDQRIASDMNDDGRTRINDLVYLKKQIMNS